MSKYILELEKLENTDLWKAKGFNSLVFDQNGLDKLEKLEEQEPEPIGFEDDDIFLLSIKEYENYKDAIPHIKAWWWLRSPGDHSDYAAYVVSDGSADYYGFSVDSGNGAVRPALKYSNLKSKIIKSEIKKDRFIFNDYPFRIIDSEKEIAIAEVPITFAKFDAESNDYKNSHIRQWLLEWMKGDRE